MVGPLWLLFGSLIKYCLADYTTHPVSLNTSLNSTVNFTCEATIDVLVILFYVDSTAAVEQPIIDRGFTELGQETINGATRRRQLSVHAREINNNSVIYCFAAPGSIISGNATLTIQGLLDSVVDLDYTFINVSSVLLTWKAPYTLDNVPITGYYIANGSFNIATTNNNTNNYTLSATNPDPCILNNVSVSPINDVGIGSSNNVSFYYEIVPLTTLPVSVVPVIDGQLISLIISINVSKLCIGEYPNIISVIIWYTNVIQYSNSISTQVNDQLMITGVIAVPNNLNTFIVNVSLSNNGGEFLHTLSFGFGYLGPVTNINSSIDNCSTIDISWTAPRVDDRVSIQYYILRIYDAIAGSLMDIVSVYDTAYQFVDNNLFINRYTYVITGVNELGEGISNYDTFSYQRVPGSVSESTVSIEQTFTQNMLTIVQFKVQVMLECTGEVPNSATVTVHCNNTGSIELSSSYVIEYTKQPNNITGSILVPLNQQCNISMVFSNEAGSSEPFILAFDTFPPSPNVTGVTTINTTIYATTTTTQLSSTTTTVSTTLNVSTVITATSLGVVIVLLLLLTISLISLVITYKRKLYRFTSSQHEIPTSHNEAYQLHTSMITTTNPTYEEIHVGEND